MRTRLPLRKEAGVVIHVCNLSNVGDRDRSSGLAGCQPRPKHANSSFQERPCPDRVSSDRSRQTSDTVLWLPLTHTGTPVCHIYHMHYPYTYTWREGKNPQGKSYQYNWSQPYRISGPAKKVEELEYSDNDEQKKKKVWLGRSRSVRDNIRRSNLWMVGIEQFQKYRKHFQKNHRKFPRSSKQDVHAG